MRRANVDGADAKSSAVIFFTRITQIVPSMGSWKVVFAPVRQWLDALGTICFFFHGMCFAVLEQLATTI
jgi:hypothetical protein